MTEPVYKYDASTLRYIKAKVRWDRMLFKGLGFIFITACFLAVLIQAYIYLFQSERQRRLSVENRAFNESKATMIGEMNILREEIGELQNIEASIQRRLFFSEQPNTQLTNSKLSKEKLLGGLQMAEVEPEEFSRIMEHTHGMLDHATKKAGLTNASYSFLFWPKKEDVNDLQKYPTSSPVKDLQPSMVACGFGEQVNPFNKKIYLHSGLDILTEIGTPVLAAADGVIKEIHLDQSPGGSGTFILLDHGNGYQTRYSRLAESSLRRGQFVRQGQAIGSVGQTGSSFAPHLHYEVMAAGKVVDPVHFLVEQLSVRDLQEIRKIAAEKRQSLD